MLAQTRKRAALKNSDVDKQYISLYPECYCDSIVSLSCTILQSSNFRSHRTFRNTAANVLSILQMQDKTADNSSYTNQNQEPGLLVPRSTSHNTSDVLLILQILGKNVDH